jgi:hypothetical protein
MKKCQSIKFGPPGCITISTIQRPFVLRTVRAPAVSTFGAPPTFAGAFSGRPAIDGRHYYILLDCFALLAMTKNLNLRRHPGGYRDPAAKGGLLTSLMSQNLSRLSKRRRTDEHLFYS